jgi:hypothetical protein
MYLDELSKLSELRLITTLKLAGHLRFLWVVVGIAIQLTLTQTLNDSFFNDYWWAYRNF